MVWRPTPSIDKTSLYMMLSVAPPMGESTKLGDAVRVKGRAETLGPLVTAPVSGRKVIGFVFSGAFYDPDSGQEAAFSLYDMGSFALNVQTSRLEVQGEFPLILRTDISEADADAKELLIASDIVAWLRKGRRTGSARRLPRVRWQEACLDQGEPVFVFGVTRRGGASWAARGYRETAFNTMLVPPKSGVGVISDVHPDALMKELGKELLGP